MRWWKTEKTSLGRKLLEVHWQFFHDCSRRKMEIWKCRNYWIILPENKEIQIFLFLLLGEGRIGFLQSSATIYLYITLNIFISLMIFTLLYKDSLSFSDDVAKTTRIGRARRRMCRSGNRSAKSSSSDSTAKTMRTWRISSTLYQVKELKREACNLNWKCNNNKKRHNTL